MFQGIRLNVGVGQREGELHTIPKVTQRPRSIGLASLLNRRCNRRFLMQVFDLPT